MPKELTDEAVLELFKSRYMTAAQVAQALGVLQDSVRKLRREHRLEPHKIGRDNFYRRADVEAYRQGKAPQGRKPKGLAR